MGHVLVAAGCRRPDRREPGDAGRVARRAGRGDGQRAVAVAGRAAGARVADRRDAGRRAADRRAHADEALRLGRGARGGSCGRCGREAEGDFNVPTPVVVGDKLLVATENNGGRLYAFRDDGTIDAEPVAVNRMFRPQMSTPVAIGSRVFCVNGRLEASTRRGAWCASGESTMRRSRILGRWWRRTIGCSCRGGGGELILVDVAAEQPRIAGRMQLASTAADRRGAAHLSGPGGDAAVCALRA